MQTEHRAAQTPKAIYFGLLAFALLTWQVQLRGPLVALDLLLSDWLQAQQAAWLTRMFVVLTDAHNTLGLLTIGAAICALLAAERRWRACGFAAMSIGGGMLFNIALKLVFHRARPAFEQPMLALDSYSFPSGHALGSTVLYGSVALLLASHPWRRPAWLAALLMVFLVALSRVYLGAHYLSDVLAGIAMGVVWISFWRLVLLPSSQR